MKKRILIQGVLAVCATVLVVIFHQFLFPQRQGLTEEISDVAGMLLVLNGFWIRIMARGYKTMCSRQSHELVTHGIYRLTRNPMYLGTLMIGAGAILVVLDWRLFLVFLAAFLVIYLPEMRKEEKWLTEHFGEVYLQYCRQTPKFIPRINGFFDARFLSELRCEWKWFWPELRAMVITVGTVAAIEVWQDVRMAGQDQFWKEAGEFVLLLACMMAVWAFLMASMKKIKAS